MDTAKKTPARIIIEVFIVSLAFSLVFPVVICNGIPEINTYIVVALTFFTYSLVATLLGIAYYLRTGRHIELP